MMRMRAWPTAYAAEVKEMEMEMEEAGAEAEDVERWGRGFTLRKWAAEMGGGEEEEEEEEEEAEAEFWMYEFKVRKCRRGRSHEWTECPWAHAGEKARRRDPRRAEYRSTPCPHFRSKGSCARGDRCEHAHGVFESWLHPCRYRTHLCRDGAACARRVCFFAHSAAQLRRRHPPPPPPSKCSLLQRLHLGEAEMAEDADVDLISHLAAASLHYYSFLYLQQQQQQQLLLLLPPSPRSPPPPPPASNSLFLPFIPTTTSAASAAAATPTDSIRSRYPSLIVPAAEQPSTTQSGSDVGVNVPAAIGSLDSKCRHHSASWGLILEEMGGGGGGGGGAGGRPFLTTTSPEAEADLERHSYFFGGFSKGWNSPTSTLADPSSYGEEREEDYYCTLGGGGGGGGGRRRRRTTEEAVAPDVDWVRELVS